MRPGCWRFSASYWARTWLDFLASEPAVSARLRSIGACQISRLSYGDGRADDYAPPGARGASGAPSPPSGFWGFEGFDQGGVYPHTSPGPRSSTLAPHLSVKKARSSA